MEYSSRAIMYYDDHDNSDACFYDPMEMPSRICPECLEEVDVDDYNGNYHMCVFCVEHIQRQFDAFMSELSADGKNIVYDLCEGM